MRLTARLLFISACLSIFALAPGSVAQVYQGKQLVDSSLVADTNAVVPGKSFTVGLRLRMAPGWHTYWKFSGDAGIPSEVKWKLPPGWKVREIQWPIPLKLKDPGDIQTYGYSDEVLLMQEITPPASIDDSQVKLSAEASWLVCERICIPGSANLQLDLPRSTTCGPANTELFARFRRLLPQPWPGADVATARWSRTGNDLRLSVTSAVLPNYPFVDFYPLPPNAVVLGHPQIEKRAGNEITFRIPLESGPPNQLSIPGLLVFAQHPDADDRMAWQLQDTPAMSSANQTPSRSLFGFLFLGFVGGLILNLMPCVLPVISLKIF